MAANSSHRAPAPSRKRVFVLLGALALTGIVYVALPKSWFEIPPNSPTGAKTVPSIPSAASGTEARAKMADRLAELRDAAQKSPLDVGSRSRYGMALASLGRGKEALPEFEAAERLAPDAAGVHHNLGVYYLNINRLIRAGAEFCRETELGPADGRAHYYRGLVLQRQLKEQPSIAQFREAIALSPQLPDTYLSLALELTRGHNEPEVLSLIDHYLKLNGDKALADYARSGAYKTWKKYPEAARYAELSVQEAPGNYGYWHNLGQIYSYAQRWDDAERTLLHAQTLSRDPSTTLIELGMNAQRAGRFEGAEKYLRQVLVASPKQGEIHLYLTRLYRHWKREQEARKQEQLFRVWEREEQAIKLRAQRLAAGLPASAEGQGGHVISEPSR